MSYQRISGIEQLFDVAEYFVIDLWGVLHHGGHIFPHAIAALEAMQQAGKTFGFLSNAPRGAQVVREQLYQRGLPKHLIEFVHTSGQEMLYYLEENPQAWQSITALDIEAVGQELIDAMPLKWVSDLAQSDVILNTGLPFGQEDYSIFDHSLEQAAQRGQPIICANPDLWALNGDALFPCAGLINQRFDHMGGQSYYFGKPYAPAYHSLAKMMKISKPERVMAIGDLIETDVLGGSRAGFRTCLIEGGVLAKQIGYQAGQSAPEEALKLRFENANANPDFITPLFQLTP